MLRRLVLNAVKLSLVVGAAYVFLFVPVGRRTPLGHLVAIFTTQPAHEAADDFVDTGRQLKQRVMDEGRRN